MVFRRQKTSGPDNSLKAITFTNTTDRPLVLVIEPIAEEYEMCPGDTVELSAPLFLGNRQVIDIEVGADMIVIYAPEEAPVKKNGELVHQSDNVRLQAAGR